MWTTAIKTSVFSRVKAIGISRLKKDFPNIYFTTSDKSLTKPKFPTVYVKKMQGRAIGQTLEGGSVNGIISAFQIEVSTNTNNREAEYVADVISDIMVKELKYDMIGDLFSDNQGDTYRNISRYQRPIGYNDIL